MQLGGVGGQEAANPPGWSRRGSPALPHALAGARGAGTNCTMWGAKTSRKHRFRATRLADESVRDTQLVTHERPTKGSPHRSQLRASGMVTGRFRLLLCAAAAVTVVLLAQRVNCLEGLAVCGDRWTGPMTVSGGVTLVVFALAIWRLSTLELDAILRQSDTARGVLGAMLPSGAGLFFAGVSFIAERYDGQAALTIEYGAMTIAGVFAVTVLTIRRWGTPRRLTVPALRRPQGN